MQGNCGFPCNIEGPLHSAGHRLVKGNPYLKSRIIPH